jgi:hypothetical protein
MSQFDTQQLHQDMGCRLPQLRTMHFCVRASRLFSVNAATAATNLNANVVNARSMLLKLPVFWQKNAV